MLGVRIPFSLFTGPLPPALACPAPAGQAPLPQGGAAAPRPEGRGALSLDRAAGNRYNISIQRPKGRLVTASMRQEPRFCIARKQQLRRQGRERPPCAAGNSERESAGNGFVRRLGRRALFPLLGGGEPSACLVPPAGKSLLPQAKMM